jgi:hypothetical protein
MSKQRPSKRPTPSAETPGKPIPRRSKIISRKCLGMEDLDRLDRMRRELFEADVARWQKGSRTKDDLIAAFGYWIGYPMFLEAVGHDWHTDTKRTAAYHALNFAHTMATRVLMEEAEKHGLDPHPLYECARVVQEIYADAPEKYYAGPYDTWPECMGTARYSLPAGQQDALRAGEAVFIRLAVKAGVDRTVKPSLPLAVGLSAAPGSKQVPWADDAEDYLPNSEAIKLSEKMDLPKLSKILKPDGPIRYMKRGQRCKVNIADFRVYLRQMGTRVSDKVAEEMAEEFRKITASKLRPKQ